MNGVDATATVVERGHAAARPKDRPTGSLLCWPTRASGLPRHSADFVWGEDAWCYVVDKPRLMAEAVRLAKPAARSPLPTGSWADALARRRAERSSGS